MKNKNMSDRLETAIKTIMDIFEAREYSEIKENNDDEDHPYITAISLKGEHVCVFRTIIQKLNTDKVKNIISMFQNLKMTRGILIHEEAPTPPVKTAIVNAPNIGLTIELFPARDLQYNITKHVLVPTHLRIKDVNELRKLRKDYKNGQLLPVLRITDPIARFYGFSKGEIIKVIRKDGIIAYRFVK